MPRIGTTRSVEGSSAWLMPFSRHRPTPKPLFV
jgi:hypothetical protein